MWDITVREKVYQRLANEIFFRVLHGEYALGAKLPSFIPVRGDPLYRAGKYQEESNKTDTGGKAAPHGSCKLRPE